MILLFRDNVSYSKTLVGEANGLLPGTATWYMLLHDVYLR